MIDREFDGTEFLRNHLGGHAYWKMIEKACTSKEEAKELVEFHYANREAVTEFMGGQEVVDSLPPSWREPMFVQSTLRYLCDWLNCWEPQVYEAPSSADALYEREIVPGDPHEW